MRKMGIPKPALFGHIPANKGMPQWLVLKVESIIQAEFGVIDLAFSNISSVWITKTIVSPSLHCLGYKVGRKSLFSFQSI
jgi:hypothetical protein